MEETITNFTIDKIRNEDNFNYGTKLKCYKETVPLGAASIRFNARISFFWEKISDKPRFHPNLWMRSLTVLRIGQFHLWGILIKWWLYNGTIGLCTSKLFWLKIVWKIIFCFLSKYTVINSTYFNPNLLGLESYFDSVHILISTHSHFSFKA